MMHRALFVFVYALAFIMVPWSAAVAEPLRIAVGAASIATLPTWVAQDSGYFMREGVPVEQIYIRGGPQTFSALIGGDVHIVQVYSAPVLSARFTGADAVIIAGLVNQPVFSVVTAGGIDRTEDLRGKRIGITTFGSATDLALRLALKKWGLKADTEVSLLQMRGVPEILGALQAKAIDAGVLSPPTNMVAIKAGFKELSYLPQAGISFQHTTLTTTRRYLDRNRATLLKVLRAYAAAIERIKADKAFTMKTISKHMRTTDSEVLEYSYNAAAPLFRAPPYPTLEGIQSTLDFLAEKEPKAKQAQPKDFVDTSLLDEMVKARVEILKK